MQSVVSIALEFQVWGISSWAILSWVLLVIWNCNGFALPHSLIGLKNVCHPPHQSRKPFTTWSLAVFFLLGGLLVFALTSYQLLWCLPLVLVTVAITLVIVYWTQLKNVRFYVLVRFLCFLHSWSWLFKSWTVSCIW